MRISSRDKLIISVAVIVVVAAALVFLLVMPRFRAIAETNAQISQAEQDIQMAKSLLARRQSAKQAAAFTEAQILRLQNQVPGAPELPALIIELQDVANVAGLDFVTLTPGPPVPGEGVTAMPVSMSVTGTWADIIDLLERLQRMTRVVRVVTLSVAPGSTMQSPDSTATVKQTETVALTLEVYTSADVSAKPK